MGLNDSEGPETRNDQEIYKPGCRPRLQKTKGEHPCHFHNVATRNRTHPLIARGQALPDDEHVVQQLVGDFHRLSLRDKSLRILLRTWVTLMKDSQSLVHIQRTASSRLLK